MLPVIDPVNLTPEEVKTTEESEDEEEDEPEGNDHSTDAF